MTFWFIPVLNLLLFFVPTHAESAKQSSNLTCGWSRTSVRVWRVRGTNQQKTQTDCWESTGPGGKQLKPTKVKSQQDTSQYSFVSVLLKTSISQINNSTNGFYTCKQSEWMLILQCHTRRLKASLPSPVQVTHQVGHPAARWWSHTADSPHKSLVHSYWSEPHPSLPSTHSCPVWAQWQRANTQKHFSM